MDPHSAAVRRSSPVASPAAAAQIRACVAAEPQIAPVCHVSSTSFPFSVRAHRPAQHVAAQLQQLAAACAALQPAFVRK